MTKNNNETIVLTLSFLMTAGIAGGTLWMFRDNFARLAGQNQPDTAQHESASIPDTPQTAVSPASPETPRAAASPTGLFNYGGSTTWAPIRGLVDPKITRAFPEFQLRYVDPIGRTPGSGSGIQMLLDGQLSFSQSSRPVNEREQQKATARGIRLLQRDVAIDGIAVVVNHDLGVRGITVGELRDIYLGKIRNWRQLGGPDLAIVPFSRRLEDGGTVEFFQEYVLNEQGFGNNVRFVHSTTPALRQVSANLGAIYFASAPEVVRQCTVRPLPIGRSEGNYVSPYAQPFVTPDRCPRERNVLNRSAMKSGEYPITRKLFVIIRDEDTPHRKAGDFYAEWLLSPAGQELIAGAGYVPLR